MSVEPRNGRDADIDYGNAAITPGFVNAHTHLELSRLDGGSPDAPEDQVDWLKRVIAQRMKRSPDEPRKVIARNLLDSLAAGTTTLADVTTAGMSWGIVAGAPIRAVVFSEIIGLKRMRGLETDHEAWEWVSSVREAVASGATAARPGISPHAPYSTAGWLYHKAAAGGLPLTTHLAEMPEEMELLSERTGRLREFLGDLGAWDDSWEPIGEKPADYIRKGELRKADWLIAHANYWAEEDFWQLRPEAGTEGSRVAVAYCPRTHARFGHAPHPYRLMLERGAVVCLGTDSLASTETLSVLDEARFLKGRDESLGGPLLLAMSTLFGAWALRSERSTGSLKAGKSADLAVIRLPDRDEADPHDLIFRSDLPVLSAYFQGLCVHGPGISG